MFRPTKEEFIELAKKGNLIPIYKEIVADLETPVSTFIKAEGGDYSYLLESVEGGEKIARYSFLGSNPSLVFKSKGKNIEIIKGKRKKRFKTKADPLSEIKRLVDAYKFVNVEGLPRFCGGLVGYVGYDMVRFFEDIPDRNTDKLKLPDSIFMLTDTIMIFDHIDHVIKVVCNVHVEEEMSTKKLSDIYDSATARIDKIIKRFNRRMRPNKKRRSRKMSRPIKSNYTKGKFTSMVNKAKEYIRSGDIIQVVLSQRLEKRLSGKNHFNIYRALRSLNPSPYMFYLKFDKLALIGSSPEIMVRSEDGKVELRPIAGTRPRGQDSASDEAYSKELLSDPKERAEHIMLVDLGRNDVGRICQYHTVNVNEFMVIEKYSHVMHIVSDITGRLDEGKDQFDVMRATFPAGTVTGAPKVRAMEIIDELEKVKRGPYAGCVGYFSFSGNLDSCITIRTIVIKDNVAYIQAGAGIVADSKPEKEYEETLNKAAALVKAIDAAEEM
ncbi:MAG: anthranilate synthase component I [Candidatus Omnitrophica bacterium]|nr:anthranilate synthase component I [Candidatus Omnitrophota bacterium]